MQESKMVELADQLLRSTRARKLDWDEGIEKNSFTVHFPDVSLSIVNSVSGFFTLELINDEGDVIETLPSRPGNTAYDTLREIYDMARRQVLDIDGTINKAIEYLGRGLQ